MLLISDPSPILGNDPETTDKIESPAKNVASEAEVTSSSDDDDDDDDDDDEDAPSDDEQEGKKEKLAACSLLVDVG